MWIHQAASFAKGSIRTSQPQFRLTPRASALAAGDNVGRDPFSMKSSGSTVPTRVRVRHGCFRVYSYPREAETPDDIAFELIEDAPERIPADQLRLKSEVEGFLTILRSLFVPRADPFKYYHARLVALAQLGLVGDAANPTA